MVSDLKTFAYKECKIAATKKKKDFFHLFTLFKRLCAPTSWSPMSQLFRFLQSLGKSNRKRCKTAALIIIVFFWRILPSVLLSALVKRCFVSRMWDFVEAQFKYIKTIVWATFTQCNAISSSVWKKHSQQKFYNLQKHGDWILLAYNLYYTHIVKCLIQFPSWQIFTDLYQTRVGNIKDNNKNIYSCVW